MMAVGSLEPHERLVEAWAVKCKGEPPALFMDKVRADSYAVRHRGVVVRLVEESQVDHDGSRQRFP